MASNLKSYEFPMPRGYYSTQSDIVGDQYALEMENFEVFNGLGVRLRGGYRDVDHVSSLLNENEYIHYTVGYGEYNHVICLIKDEVAVTGRVIVYDVANDAVVSDKLDALAFDTPVSHLEVTTGDAGNPVLLFYAANSPLKIQRLLDGNGDPEVNDYVIEVSGIDFLHNLEFAYTDPSGGVVYNSRLYMFKEGFNTIYYLPVGLVEGEPVALNPENIFGVKGTVVRLIVTGFSAGAGVQSWLSCLFDSGDILNFNGYNPDSADDWRVESKVSINVRIYKGFINYGTTAYIMTDLGILDLARVIAENGVTTSASIGMEIDNDLRGERDSYRFHMFGERLLVRHVLQSKHFVYNTRYSSWCKYTNFEVIAGDTLGGNLYFVGKDSSVNNDEFTYGKRLLEGFDNFNDGGEAIIGILHSNWFDMGSNFTKEISYDYMNIGYDGEYEFSIAYDLDYRRGSHRSFIELKDTTVSWEEISNQTWSFIKGLLWTGSRSLRVGGWKNTRAGIGRSISYRISVSAINSVGFVFSRLKCDYNVGGR